MRWPAELALLCALLGALAAAGSADAAPPNVVVFYADDLGYGDLGSYGHPSIRTPNLDALAAEGQRWTDFYAPAPVCSPSRGALLTGRWPVRTGLYGERIAVLFPNAVQGLPAEEDTLAEALKRAGYATAIFGKWHLGDAPDHYPTRHGFDVWEGLPYSNDMDWVGEATFDELLAMSVRGDNEAFAAAIAGRSAKYFAPDNAYWNVPLLRSLAVEDGFEDALLAQPPDQRRLTALATEATVRFIEAHRRQPFFVYVPYSMPHTPIFAGEGFDGSSRGGRYGDVVEELDASVGTVVAALKRLRLQRRTLVIFTSDNGPWLTMRTHGGTAGLLRHGKGTTFEGGVRVPAIFSWPGKLEPGVVSDIGSGVDLMPTILALAGAGTEAVLDGKDLSPTLLDGAPGARDELPYYRAGQLLAYRKGRYKLHRVTEGAYGQPPERQSHEPPLLYNLGSDAGERYDVAAAHPEIVREILAAIAAHEAALPRQPPLFDLPLARAAAQAAP